MFTYLQLTRHLSEAKAEWPLSLSEVEAKGAHYPASWAMPSEDLDL